MEHENITPQESVCRGEEEEKEALVWEEICTEHVVQDQWIDFRRSSYRLPDGSVFAPFYTYSRRDYVVIVATDEDGNCLCVRQFRQGIRQVTTEFPAGGIERTDGREYGPGSRVGGCAGSGEERASGGNRLHIRRLGVSAHSAFQCHNLG